MVGSIGRVKSHASRPSAKKFLERSTSRPLTPLSLTASLVRLSMGASMIRNGATRSDLERVFLVSGLVQVALIEGLVVDDEGAARPQIRQVGLEGRRVHCHEAIGSVPGREDVVIGDLHLEGRDTGKGAGRSADLGRERREGRQIVAEIGGGVSESASGNLHAVTGVTRKANDDLVEDLSVV